jgi:uncharacterized protein YdcH (DUF465 family)
MENNSVLVGRLKSENQDFQKWSVLHGELEERLICFKQLKFLTSDEEMEKKKIQKQKLIAKDHMENILTRYRRMN